MPGEGEQQQQQQQQQRKPNASSGLNMSQRIVFVVVVSCFCLASMVTIFLICRHVKGQEGLILSRPVVPCDDPLCVQRARILLKYSGHGSVDPCLDFYDYSCGRFDLERISHEQGEVRDEQGEVRDDWTPVVRLGKWASIQMHRMLEDKNIEIRNQSKSFDLATQYYKACLMKFSDTRSEAEKYPAFQKLISLFQEIMDVWRPENNNLEYILGFLAVYDIDAIIKVGQVYSPTLGKYLVSLDAGALTYEGSYGGVRSSFEGDREAFVKNMRQASLLVNDTLGREVWDLEFSLFKISYNYWSSTFYENNSGYFEVQEVQEMLRDSINLSILINEMFNKPVRKDQIVFVKNINYLKNLHFVLSKFSRKDLINLLKWHFVRASLKLLSSDFSEYLSSISTDASRASGDCLPSTMDIFRYATGILYSRERRLTPEDKQLISNIFEGLKETFEELINNRMWLVDADVRGKIIGKLRTLTYDLVEDDDLELAALNEYYNEISITRNQLKNFFGGMAAMKNKEKLLNWLVHPVDTQVAFNPLTNKIEIPLGLLQSPVFQSVYPASVLYGTLGSILARQLSYSLNEFGLADLRAQDNCYSEYYRQGKVFNAKFLENELVRDEIEADHLSVRLSYSAYRNWQATNHNNETKLRLEDLNTRQTFFLSYVQTWCRTLQPNNWMDLNPNYDFQHPSKLRINNALKSIPEFSQLFKCPVGSPMNPAKKCLLW